MLKFSFTPLLLLLTSLGICQSKMLKGYIVLNSGDTLTGLLREDVESKLTQGVIFETSSGDKKLMGTNAIQAFGYESGPSYQKVSYTNPLEKRSQLHFAKYLVNGSNDLFSFMEKDIRYFIVITPKDSTYILFNDRKTPSGELIERGNYMNQLNFISVGCEPAQQRAQALRYQENSLAYFIHLLNQCQNPSAPTTLLFKKAKTEMRLYIYGGALPLGNRYEFTGQFLVRFILPSQTRKTSLNTGLIYAKNKRPVKTDDVQGTSEEEIFTDLILLPLTIQANLTRGVVQPYINAGLGGAVRWEKSSEGNEGLQRSFGVTLILGAGVEVSITNRLMAKLDARYDLLFHYPTIGVAYRVW